jgi:hypothetical protein
MTSPIFTQLTVWELTALINLYTQDQADQVEQIYNHHASSTVRKNILDWKDLDPDGFLRESDEILEALRAELQQRQRQ